MQLIVGGTLQQVKDYVCGVGDDESGSANGAAAVGSVAAPVIKEQHVDWANETTLPDDIAAALKALDSGAVAVDSAPRQSGAAHVFLTGATGFLGLFTLAELLSHSSHTSTDASCSPPSPLPSASSNSSPASASSNSSPARFNDCMVTCLVRGKDAEHARQRLVKAAADSLEKPLDWLRIQVVCGDFSLPQFGLCDADYDQIAANVTDVIHCGARVTGLLSYSGLRAANVDSTMECVRLVLRDVLLATNSPATTVTASTSSPSSPSSFPAAAAASVRDLPHLVFVSSLSSLTSSDPVGETSERALSVERLKFMRGYGASKRVSEILLNRCTTLFSGLRSKVAVVRPGTIGGSGSNGAYNTNDTLPRLLLGMWQMKAGPNINHRVDACDVRVVAKIVVHAESGVYHARGHGGLSVSEMVKTIIANHGGDECNNTAENNNNNNNNYNNNNNNGKSSRCELVEYAQWTEMLASEQRCGPNNALYTLKEIYFGDKARFPLGQSDDCDDSRAQELLSRYDPQGKAMLLSPLTAEVVARWVEWLKRMWSV